MEGYDPDEPCRPLSEVRWPRDMPLVEPAWRTTSVLRMAGSCRATGDHSALPILADALEEAECDNQFLLNHCRSSGPHRPDCWAVTAILISRPPPEPQPLTVVETYRQKRAAEAELRDALKAERAGRMGLFGWVIVLPLAVMLLLPYLVFLAEWLCRP